MTEEHEDFLNFMNSVRDARKEFSQKLTRYVVLDAASTRITPNWSADGGHGGDSQSVWAQRADEAEIVRDAKAALDQAEESLRALIGQVDNKLHRRILLLRYVRCIPWKHVRAMLDYSDGYLYQCHRQALADAEAIWRNEHLS